MNSSKQRETLIGSLLAILAATAWGVSGNFSQLVFESYNVNLEWLVTIRLLISGLILLIFSQISGRKIFALWKDRRTALRLGTFGVIGMLGVQYTYLAAIAASNAATATILQYLGPLFITAYYAAKYKRLPTRIEATAVILAMLGTALLVTHGDLKTLAISNKALILGLASAVTLAIYSIIPVPLLKNNDSTVVLGWGMIIGGIIISLFKSPFSSEAVWTFTSIASIGFIVLIGSLFAFFAYLTAVRFIGPTKASLLACAEPLSASFVAVLWMDVKFDTSDWIGATLIICTILILSYNSNGTKAVEK
ncbi:EamA family transporter [Bdellovibrio sp. ZAP7]|nr:EamA family transporter [Bdellovibrio sp. ZAP7]